MNFKKLLLVQLVGNILSTGKSVDEAIKEAKEILEKIENDENDLK